MPSRDLLPGRRPDGCGYRAAPQVGQRLILDADVSLMAGDYLAAARFFGRAVADLARLRGAYSALRADRTQRPTRAGAVDQDALGDGTLPVSAGGSAAAAGVAQW